MTTGTAYVEHLRRPDLSLGTYSLLAGAEDTQEPHTEDEIYVVTSGGPGSPAAETVDVAAGSVFYVAAQEVHRFHDITEDLAVLVFFGPAEGTVSASCTCARGHDGCTVFCTGGRYEDDGLHRVSR